MTAVHTSNRRILIVDDNEDIHHDFRRILRPGADTAALDDLEAMLLGGAPESPKAPMFELTSAYQGVEALAKVRKGLEEGAPYALAFIDMRMPPGWDGVETLARLWQEDPHLQAVICSAYSDFSWESVSARFGQTERLLILKKPFDAIEVRQMACALVEKWNQRTASQQVEQALRRSEAYLRGLLHVLPDALLRVAADGTCLEFKASREVAPSARLAFVPGGTLGDVLPADVARGMLAHLGRALREGTTQVAEYELPVGGQRRRFEARIAASDVAEGLVLLRDVTASPGRIP
jgi:CheY-like chemotaxis protein